MSQVIYLSDGANESDIASALALIGNEGGTLVLPKNAEITISDGLKIDVTNRDITIDLNGSTLRQGNDVTVISANGMMGTTKAVAIDTTGTNAKITYDAVPGDVQVGSWIKIASDDILPNDNRNTELPTRLGQAMQVVSINGNVVELAGEPLYADQYATNVRAAQIVSGTLKITNGTVQGDQTDPTWLSTLVNIRDAIGVEIDHLTVKDGNSMGINLVNNVNSTVRESVAMNLRDDTTIGWYGYGVHSAGSLNTTVIGLYAEQVRHATDDNGVGVAAGDPSISKYGADIGMVVRDSVSYRASAFSYSFHSEGRNGLLDNVASFESHGFVGIRGVGNSVTNSISVGDERAFQYFEYGYGDAKDSVIDNVIVREAGVYVHNVQGDPTNNIIKNSYLEYDYRTGNPGSTVLVDTTVVKTDGVDDDVISGTDAADRLLGGRGIDILSGGNGNDYIWGGQENDTLTGGAGSDRFVLDRTDSVDTVTDFQSGEGGDILDVSILGARYGWRGDYLANGYVVFEQSGNDTLVKVNADPANMAVTIAILQNVSADTLTVSNLQMTISGNASTYVTPPLPTTVLDPGSIGYAKGVTITGTTGADYIDGSHSVPGQPLPTLSADSIATGSGDDYIDGLGGADNINTGAGNDTVVYYSGIKATLQGGSGRDTLLLNSSDVIDLSSSDQSEGLAVVSGFDDVDGRSAGVGLSIFGNANNNNLWGGAGDDRFRSNGGNDRIDGGAGDDIILFDGNRDDYSFIRISADTWRAQDLRIPTSPYRTYLTSVERVSFNDQLAQIETLNRPPSDLVIDNSSVAENAPGGTIVGHVQSIDLDVSEINTFTLLDDDGGRFAISGNLIVATGPLDAEDGLTHSIIVQVSDSDGHLLSKQFEISVGDVNDTAPVLTLGSSLIVDENQRVVGDLTASDADQTGETVSFSIVEGAGDGALFTIEGTQLLFRTAPDYESGAGPYQVTVETSDGVNSRQQVVTVMVGDVKTGDVMLGTSGDDMFTYASTLGYDHVDGAAGSDTVVVATGAAGRIGAASGSLLIDADGDGTTDLFASNVEHLELSGSDVVLGAGLAATGLVEAKLAGTSGADRFDGALGDVALMLSGLGGNDVLLGGSGADLLDGGTGDDRMVGGLGDDIYVVDTTGDSVEEAADGGSDTVQTSLASYVLGANVEALSYLGTRAFTGTGNVLDNVLTGGSGADRLDGLGGADVMKGGAGNDTYVVDNAGDVVIELAGQGTDRVLSQISYTLSDNIETLQLSTSKALNGTGNDLGNTIIGNAGVNILDGRGGADMLTGGAGDDVFVFQRGEGHGDVVTDFAGAGVAGGDSLRFIGYGADAYLTQVGTSDVYTIHAGSAYGDALETIRLAGVTQLTGADYSFDGAATAPPQPDPGPGPDTGPGTGTGGSNVFTGSDGDDQLDGSTYTADLTLSGLGGNDVLLGGSGADLLDGGTGDDRMVGGLGDDLYVVDTTGDLVEEAAGGGTDTVQTSLSSYVLGANVEALSYLGTRAFTGTGNVLDNMLTGGSGADRLDGLGGADMMKGGAGNDTYVVDNVGDVVIELAGQGTDRVLSQISYTLSDNIETLQLSTSKALNGTGNDLGNTIIGNAGVNILDGRGGADMLTGGAGDDVFVFQRGEGHGDVVTDFAGAGVAGGDSLRFIGYGADAYLTQVGTSDVYTIHAGSAYGDALDTIRLAGVTQLTTADYLFA
ncbi:hypothetical protein [Sphingobium sp. CECT 9361]|uniref:beta strand repeat-containing protein n=1 Tax=Sphingobium sp. CECT 9361 TaxID=2845384 RepID=UPI001E57FDAF|nr:hypothetical protein [Sphingobium sp. CECT 9361]CAH0356454.1 hypothetical protein SPH9361_04098 [Sphingobium sp. CECT 9361]